MKVSRLDRYINLQHQNKLVEIHQFEKHTVGILIMVWDKITEHFEETV
jgi:hypothetical protein